MVLGGRGCSIFNMEANSVRHTTGRRALYRAGVFKQRPAQTRENSSQRYIDEEPMD